MNIYLTRNYAMYILAVFHLLSLQVYLYNLEEGVRHGFYSWHKQETKENVHN